MASHIGADLIEIERIVRALERPGFRDRCFTPAEQEYCESRRFPARSYAARFCGKEAVGKAPAAASGSRGRTSRSWGRRSPG